MKENLLKLIIWDFDGVIADSEKLWLKNRMEILNRDYGLNWDFETVNKHLGGMSDKTKRIVLQNMGIILKDDFEEESLKLDYISMAKEMKATPGVENIFKTLSIKQCIATGGLYEKTIDKIKAVKFEKFFSKQNIFTADMVEHGKPEPDLFLLAAEKMKEKPENCLVVEDSIAGMTAAIRAKIPVAAFLGSEIYHSSAYKKQVENLGIKDIFYNMDELKVFLEKKLSQAKA